jgi:hypothetical protein
MYTVLEIGSGSFKLHRNNDFSLRFESSLGKNLNHNRLDGKSVITALENLQNKILPFLSEQDIKPQEVIVIATAAIRKAMNDPKGSGQFFIDEVIRLGFPKVKVLSEAEECDYAAYGVIDEVGDLHDKFLMLDTGGASHQLVEFDHGIIKQKISVNIGSHSDFKQEDFVDFAKEGFSISLPLAVIGTSGLILNYINNLNRQTLKKIIDTLENLDIKNRREFLELMVDNPEIYELFVDFRLAILPKAFSIILNCAENLKINKFIYASNQAVHYISKNGLSLNV